MSNNRNNNNNNNNNKTVVEVPYTSRINTWRGMTMTRWPTTTNDCMREKVNRLLTAILKKVVSELIYK